MNQHWAHFSLGDLFEIGRGGSPRPIENYITDSPDGLNWIKIGDATGGGKFIERTKEKIRPEGLSKTRQVKVGDFLLTNSMSFGRPYIMATDGCIHDGWLLLRPRKEEQIDRGYFYHLLSSDVMYLRFASRASGSTVKNLNTEIVSSVQVQLPPLDEQRRIAAILDKADGLRQKRKRAIALLDSLMQSIFTDLFGDPAHNRLGLPVGKIGDLLDAATYGSSGKAGPTGEYPMLRMGNLTTAGQMDYSDLKYIDLVESEVDRYTVKRGDILFNRTNSAELVGKTAVFDKDEPYAFAGYLVRARTRSGYSPEYVSGYLNSSHGKKTLRGMAKSIVGMANINAKEMQTIPILVPDQASQQQYARLIEGIRERKSRYGNNLLREIEQLFTSLQHRAFSGQL